MKKTLAVVCCAAMLLSSAYTSVLSVQAAEVTENTAKSVTEIQPSGMSESRIRNNTKYMYAMINPNSSPHVGIVDYLGNSDNIILPEKIEDVNVDTIGKVGMTVIETNLVDYSSEILNSPFCNNTKIKSVTVPESISSIYTAFRNCPNLTKVEIMNSEAAIGDGSFDNCPNLTIYGKKGSTAETYAADHGIPFAVIGENYTPPAESKPAESQPTESNTANSKPAAVDFDGYFTNEIANKIGYADTSDKTTELSQNNPNDDSWSNRSGAIGYEIGDYNGDGIDEMLVFSMSGRDINISSYINKNGTIEKADEIVIQTSGGGSASYFSAKIMEIKGKKYLYIERFNNSTFFSNGSYVAYEFYEIRTNKQGSAIEENGDILLRYHVGMGYTDDGRDAGASYPIVYKSLDYGDYSKTERSSGSTTVKGKIINDGNGSIDGYDSLRSALVELGMPSTDKRTHELLTALGFKNYEQSIMGNYPTYFFDDTASVIFTYVNGPTDLSTNYSSATFSFKNVLQKYSTIGNATRTTGNSTDTANNTSNTTGNTSSKTNSSTNNSSSNAKSPQTGVANNYLAMISVLILSGAAAVITRKKDKETD